jgi:hypothetical protein
MIHTNRTLDETVERLKEEVEIRIEREKQQKIADEQERKNRMQREWQARLQACLRKYPIFRGHLPETPPSTFYAHAVLDHIPITKFGENRSLHKPTPVLAIEVTRLSPDCEDWAATDLIMQTFLKTIRFSCADEDDVINAIRMTLYYMQREKRDAGN